MHQAEVAFDQKESQSSKLAGQKVTLSIQAKEQRLEVVYPQEYRRSLPRKRLASTSTTLSGVCSNHAARSLHSNLVCLLWGGGKSAQTDRLLHTMQGNFPSDEMGKPYTHPVGISRAYEPTMGRLPTTWASAKGHSSLQGRAKGGWCASSRIHHRRRFLPRLHKFYGFYVSCHQPQSN